MRLTRVIVVLGGLAVTLALLTGGAVWSGSEQTLKPPWYVYPRDAAGGDPLSEHGLAFEEVEFRAAGGSTLRGWFVPASPLARIGVVLVHGAGSTRRNYLDRLPEFHAAGYPALLFDCRDQGLSDGAGRGIGLGFRERHDVSSAVAYMKRTRRLRRVAAVGTSQGGASVLMAAAGDPGIDVVVAENPWASSLDLMREHAERTPLAPMALVPWVHELTLRRLGAFGEPEPIDVVGRIAPQPLLIAHGTADASISYAQSEALFAAAGEPKELWIAEGAVHDGLYDHDPETYRKRVVGFLRRWLGAAPPPDRPGPPPLRRDS